MIILIKVVSSVPVMKLHMWQQRKREFSVVDAKKAKRFAIKVIRDGNAVLDVGCGDCDFFDMIRAQKKDCKLFGYDIVPEALQICKRKGYTPVRALKNMKNKFDVITLFECFEHLTYAQRQEYVAFIEESLKSKGYVVLSFPHIKSMLSILHYYDNPEHKEPFPLESNLMKFFENFTIVGKTYLSPWVHPLKVIHCVLTGLSLNAVYNNVCFVLQKKD